MSVSCLSTDDRIFDVSGQRERRNVELIIINSPHNTLEDLYQKNNTKKLHPDERSLIFIRIFRLATELTKAEIGKDPDDERTGITTTSVRTLPSRSSTVIGPKEEQYRLGCIFCTKQKETWKWTVLVWKYRECTDKWTPVSISLISWIMVCPSRRVLPLPLYTILLPAQHPLSTIHKS